MGTDNIVNSDSCRSWFIVWNNPEKYYDGLSPDELVNKVAEEWMAAHPKGAVGCSYEIGKKTGNHHIHCILEDPAKVRFSNIKKLFPGAHIEPTMGKKNEAEDYLFKRGRFADDNDCVVVPPLIMGNLKSNRGSGKKSIFEEVDDLIADGYRPSEIICLGSRFAKQETAIRAAFMAKKMNEIKDNPFNQEVIVDYHTGASGSGKTYSAYMELAKKYGEDEIYVCPQTSESGYLDFWEAEKCIILDELRNISYATLLTFLQAYKRTQIHARYRNVRLGGLVRHIAICSIYPPEDLYNNIVPPHRRYLDSYEQLLRRITNVIFHYVDDGEYKTYTVPGSEYKNYEDLRARVFGDTSGFMKIEKLPGAKQMEIPFN